MKKTDVKAIRYRTFVGSNPTKTTYFQPVLDSLDVAFSPLIYSSEALIIEGKFDYHPLAFFLRNLAPSSELRLFPTNGAGSAASLISLFRGWGVKFRILLDGDKAGKDGKKTYMADYLLSDSEVIKLDKIDSSFAGKSIEALYATDTIAAVKKKFQTASPSKRQFALFFQEMLASGSDADLPETTAAFVPIGEWLKAEFNIPPQ